MGVGALVKPPLEVCDLALERRVFLTTHKSHCPRMSQSNHIIRSHLSSAPETRLGSQGAPTDCWPRLPVLGFHKEGNAQYSGRMELSLLGR